MVETARTLNPGIEVVLHAHNPDESALLQQQGLGTVFCGEEALAQQMTGHVTQRFMHAQHA